MLNPYNGTKITVTSRYGIRTLSGTTGMHRGLDIVGVDSKEIIAIASGTVVRSRIVTDKNNATWTWGNYVAVKQDDGNTCYYCHMSKRSVKVGDKVKVGDVLGIEGNTGYVVSAWGGSGAHLHLEIRNAAGTAIDISKYTGIPNAIGTYTIPKTTTTTVSTGTAITANNMADYVCKECGLDTEARQYIQKYTYGNDIWRRIYNVLKK